MANSINPFVIHLICSSGFYGAERVVANLCQEMKGASVSVLCLTPNKSAVVQFQSKVEQSGTSWASVDNSIHKAIKHIQGIKTHHKNIVIHAHGYKEIVVACLFKKVSGCGVIVTQHGFTERNFKSRCYNWIDMGLCRWTDIKSVLCVSGDIYKRYSDFGVSSSRLVLLPNGVLIKNDLEQESVRVAIAKQLDVSVDMHIVLYAGRLSEEKDPVLFVETIKIMMASSLDFVAVIAGEGPLYEVVCRELDAFSHDGRVKMLGFVENMDDLLVASDILLLTSKTEGTPMIVLEAMMQRCAVVATNVGGMSEIITHGNNGYLVNDRVPDNLATCCKKLLNDSAEHQRLTISAKREVLGRFSLHSQMDGYRKLYKECLE
ncbi:MAG: glycosyltransferase family 4 protein [Pseudomonadales bacterium]|nr:glycosyltransferase family 4 protein [Pseudomonadales bacterium]